MRLKIPTCSSLLSQQSDSLVPHPRNRPSPLLVPEILQHILTFLSQSTLRYSAVLVSHLWSEIAQELVQRTVFLSIAKPSRIQFTPSLALDCINSADALVLRCEHLSNIQSVMASRRKSSPRVQVLNKLETLARKGKLRLRDLDVQINTDEMDWPGLSLLLNIVGPSLTHLRLKIFSLNHIFPLSTVLDSCPGLLVLHVEASTDDSYIEASQLEERCLFPDELETPFLTSNRSTFGATSTPKPRTKWRLQSCTFDDMYLTATALEALLPSCPDLTELRLVSIRSRMNSLTTEQSLYSQEPREQFLRQLGLVCPGLKSFHISLCNSPLQVSEPLIAELPSLLTKIDTISVDQQSLYRQSVHSSLLSAHWNENRMTTLEIVKDKISTTIRTENMIKIGDLLHAFLCEATGLQHLKGHGGYITFDNLRVTRHGTMTWYPTRRAWARSKTRIWACRGLKTLEVEFVAGGAKYLDDREHSRLVFGYISKSPLWKSDLDWIKKYHHYNTDTGLSLSEQNLQGRWKRMAENCTGGSEGESKAKSKGRPWDAFHFGIRHRLSRILAYLEDGILKEGTISPMETRRSLHRASWRVMREVRGA
ncbi:unnamed protein product [Mortierella alpina]